MQKIKNIENRNFLIYVLKDPYSLEVRYVGVTCTTLSARLSQHIYDSKKLGTYKRNWISKLVIEGKKPLIETIEVCNYKNWEDREIYWIGFYKNLTNTREGGKGVILNRSEDSIQRSSKAKMKKVVAINENRDVLIFKSHKEASYKLNIPRTSIEYSLLNIDYCSYGYNFIEYSEYVPGIEKTIKITPKKNFYKIMYDNKEFSPKELSNLLNVNEATVYLWCSGKTNWKNSTKLKNKKIDIIMI